jgi:hypothetical protein
MHAHGERIRRAKERGIGMTNAPITRRAGALAIAIALLGATAQSVAAAAPSNDLVSGATQLKLNTPVEFNSAEATMSPSDPTDCDGSHGPWPGPYFASAWFSYTATSTGQLNLSSPTMQGTANDFLAISFVYRQDGSDLTLVDCTAFGNDASWSATPGQKFLIMEAGLSTAVTEDPDFSDKGGHGTIAITRSANVDHYSWIDFFTYDDCGLTVEGAGHGSGSFHLRPGKHGDPTPYLFDNYSWEFVSTNPANGKWFREYGQGLYRDLHITNVEGTVYTFESQETGRPYTLVDMNGNKVFFDRGRLLTTFQVDTKGDDDLSNDEFIEDSWSLLAENGSHPGFFFDGEWCDIVNDLLG